MREIKFRAHVKDTGAVLPVQIIDWYNQVVCMGYGEEDIWEKRKLSDVDLMQYTDLKDKNGVEIYEADVLLHWEKRYLVSWDEQMAAFQSVNVRDAVDADFFNWGNVPSLQAIGAVSPLTGAQLEPNCEVIGNIYENPELLEAK